MIDPAPYDVNSKITMLTSFTSPILINDKFHDIARTNLTVNFIQELLIKTDTQLYGNTNEITLITNNDHIITSTQTPAIVTGKQIGRAHV